MRKTTTGFTIVELLIVIVVIAILAAIITVAYRGIQDRARTDVVKADLNQALKQLTMDKVIAGAYPISTAADSGQGLHASTGTPINTP